jgi:general transcription factor 3C polypeptide 3 (transcription factor C subunit 4)
MKLAEIYEILNEPRKALELVYEGLSIFLSLCYFTLHLTESTYTPPVIDSRKKRPKEPASQNYGHQASEDPSGTSLFEEKSSIIGGAGAGARSKTSSTGAGRPGKLTHAQLRELEAAKEREVVRGYKKVSELWGKMMKGAGGSQEEEDQEALREWMVEAEKMVETFRETRNLFLTSRVGFFFFPLG